MDRVVIDTNILVSAIMKKHGAPRSILRLALERKVLPVIGNALFCEYEDVLARKDLFANAPISAVERETLLDAMLSVCEWVPIYFLWRPNLPDEGDNHLIVLAIAGGATAIITGIKKHVDHGEIAFPNLKVQTAVEFLREWSET